LSLFGAQHQESGWQRASRGNWLEKPASIHDSRFRVGANRHDSVRRGQRTSLSGGNLDNVGCSRQLRRESQEWTEIVRARSTCARANGLANRRCGLWSGVGGASSPVSEMSRCGRFPAVVTHAKQLMGFGYPADGSILAAVRRWQCERSASQSRRAIMTFAAAASVHSMMTKGTSPLPSVGSVRPSRITGIESR
jgi:hypothetical protein